MGTVESCSHSRRMQRLRTQPAPVGRKRANNKPQQRARKSQQRFGETARESTRRRAHAASVQCSERSRNRAERSPSNLGTEYQCRPNI